MKLESITLRNFRNIEDSTLRSDPHLSFLVGSNGQGKTSFLEAIGYLATLRSFRNAKSEEVIRYGCQAAEIVARITEVDWNTELKLIFNREGERTSKVAFINGKPYRSSTSYLSQRFGSFTLGFHAVIFNPSDHDLVRGEPALRRSYLDRVLAAEDIEYLKVLQKFNRTLDQRNALLRGDERPSRTVLAGFTEPFVHYGSVLAHKRLGWLLRLKPRLNDRIRQIAPKQPDLRAVYVSNWVPQSGDLSIYSNKLSAVHFTGHCASPSLELLEQAFWTKLSALEQTELEARSSLVGPHRDDWSFYLGEHLLKGHGSQGETRSALLALKLSEIELFQEQTGHRPLLLLDDFSSELDQERRSFLLSSLLDTDLQVVVTTTEANAPSGKRYRVQDGALTEEKPSLNPESRADFPYDDSEPDQQQH